MSFTEIPVRFLKVGMAFSAPLLDSRSQKIVLPQDYPVFHGFIEECLEHHIETIITQGEVISDPKKYPHLFVVPITYQVREYIQLYYDSIKILKTQFSDPKNIKLEALQTMIAHWIKHIGKTNQYRQSQVYLQVIRHTSINERDYFYAHSLDVMLITIGVYTNYRPDISQHELMHLALGAVLFDIGMILLPDHIKFHQGEYDDAMIKQVRTHPVLGFKFLSSALKVPTSFAYSALEHHERIDGSGYPYAISGDKIHDTSIVVSLADSFTAQLRSRTYREAKELVEVLKDFLTTTIPLFKKHTNIYLKAFLAYVGIYPITSIVLLDTGEVAMVTDTFLSDPLKPDVMVLLNKSGQVQAGSKFYYLSDKEFKHINIKGVYAYKQLKELDALFPKAVYDIIDLNASLSPKKKKDNEFDEMFDNIQRSVGIKS
ncbi:MAG: HD-GYP domain-containing protein [Brevinema sp.]